MLPLFLVLLAMGAWLMAALALLGKGPRETLHQILGGLGALASLGAAIRVLATGKGAGLDFRLWDAPARLEIDPLAAAFMLPLALVSGLGVIYAREYWPLNQNRGHARQVRVFFAVLTASMLLVLTARQGVLFLMGWEAMALAAFFLVQADHEKPEVQRAGWIYLMCTHTGTLVLIAMVGMLFHRMGSLSWLPVAGSSGGLDGAILLAALAGFGFKAGFIPLHFWLPEAHAAAPSHVSAILSAIMLKMGIYGMLRVASLLPQVPSAVGEGVLILGVATAVYGVVCSLAQNDYKRLLAYSSVENLGIIGIGLGLGWLGRAWGSPWVAALGFGGAIFHVWNHALFKSLLFMGAGSLLHATGTRQIDALGGLGARMPRTALLLFPGVLAVSALPPFNGFLSEWFLYRGLFAAIAQGPSWVTALAIPGLALTGGFAAVAFAKFFGMVFLGEPRSPAVDHAHDPGPSMLVPMAVLACLCLGIGLGGVLLLPVLDRVVGVLAPEAAGLLAQGLRFDLGLIAVLLLLFLALAGILQFWMSRGPQRDPALPRPPTWDCGYARPTCRMEYTGSSFSEGWAASWPGVQIVSRRIRALFPKPANLRVKLQDALGDGRILPGMAWLSEQSQRFRHLQQGQLSAYLLYILVALLGTFLWLLARPRLLG